MITQQLDVFINIENRKLLVGKLLQKMHEIFFEYASDFLTTNLDISPFKLSLKSGVQNNKEKVFAGLPGVFHDSLPDGWGLLLMDRYFRKNKIDPHTVTPLQRLAYLGERALGALSYEPCDEFNFNLATKLKLETLARNCEKFLQGKDQQLLPELIIAGGSPGGARPKVIVAYNSANETLLADTQNIPQGYQHFLIKFSALTEISDKPEIEYAYSLMAHDCGVTMSETRLFNAGKFGPVFGTARFDRKGDQRIHMHTLSGLLHADYRIPNLDYSDYLKATWVLTQNIEEVYQAYRRMIFNILTHNRDDHSKNFSFLLDEHQWRLSPAYDLTFSSGIAGEHTMTIAGEGANPKLEHCLEVAKKLDLNAARVKTIIKEVSSVIADWSHYAKQAKVIKADQKHISSVFNNLKL